MTHSVENDAVANVCLECWRDFTADFLHLDCTGEHVVSKAEANDLRQWLTGRYKFLVRTGQRVFPPGAETDQFDAEQHTTRTLPPAKTKGDS